MAVYKDFVIPKYNQLVGNKHALEDGCVKLFPVAGSRMFREYPGMQITTEIKMSELDAIYSAKGVKLTDAYLEQKAKQEIDSFSVWGF